jgi:ATP-dependent exoDNAse (exonuclease V) beta subunit
MIIENTVNLIQNIITHFSKQTNPIEYVTTNSLSNVYDLMFIDSYENTIKFKVIKSLNKNDVNTKDYVDYYIYLHNNKYYIIDYKTLKNNSEKYLLLNLELL